MPSIDSESVTERRSYSRYNLPLILFINTKGEDGDSLCNISKGGACFKSPVIFNIDDFVLMHFLAGKESPLDNIKFSLVGRIIRVDEKEGDQFKYGVKFEIFNDPFSREQYSKMISSVNQFAAGSSEFKAN